MCQLTPKSGTSGVAGKAAARLAAIVKRKLFLIVVDCLASNEGTEEQMRIGCRGLRNGLETGGDHDLVTRVAILLIYTVLYTLHPKDSLGGARRLPHTLPTAPEGEASRQAGRRCWLSSIDRDAS